MYVQIKYDQIINSCNLETVVSEMFVFVAQFGLFDIWLQGRERIVWKLTTVASLGAVSSASVPRLYPADNAEEKEGFRI